MSHIQPKKNDKPHDYTNLRGFVRVCICLYLLRLTIQTKKLDYEKKFVLTKKRIRHLAKRAFKVNI